MRSLPVLTLLALLPLAACQKNAPADAQAAASASQAGEDEGLIARTARQALESAKVDLAKGNIPVGGRGAGNKFSINGVRLGDHDNRTSHLPRAEITPEGDLLVDGRAVQVDDAQRKLLLEHRANILAIAQAGVDIGIQGASLGAKAATGALAAAFSGQSEEFERRMQAEARKIEAQAVKLCSHLPALRTSQQALAAALPAFQPYAVLEESDIKDCEHDIKEQAESESED